MAATELDIRNAIVTLILSVAGAGRVYNRLRKPPGALLSEFNTLNVDDASKINVVFVRRVSFTEQVSSFDDPISSTETYELWFFRGVVDVAAADEPDPLVETNSESELQLFIENVRAAFKLPANRDLGLAPPDVMLSQGGMGTAAPLIDTSELGGYDCHRFVGRITVSIEDC
jgi:hypothetical protein